MGTKSVLFGVHQFLWHPLTVARAWADCWGRWPNWREWVVIFCHDIGYFGCPNMDGPEGTRHPLRGAALAAKIVARTVRVREFLALAWWFTGFKSFWQRPGWCLQRAWAMARSFGEAAGVETYFLALYHSRHFAKLQEAKPSALFLPDKLCVRYDPPWFYLLRARLSGELTEYLANAETHWKHFETPREWYAGYREKCEDFIVQYGNQ